MSKKFLIKLTPLEPYFFGGERVFDYGATQVQQSGKYFIRSLNTPSQAALFGTLRFLLKKDPGYRITPADELIIGKESFDLQKSEQFFGIINEISPLYIADEKNNFFIKIPFDHKIEQVTDEVEYENKEYMPFEEYNVFETSEGKKLIPADYKAKIGIADGYMNATTGLITKDDKGEINESIFDSTIRVGIDKNLDKNAFFKKEFKLLKKGMSFAFFATLNDDQVFINKNIVYMGQAKSSFSVEIVENISEPDIKPVIRKGFAYALSDIYLNNGSAGDLYKLCEFVDVKLKDYRGFTTNHNALSQYDRYVKNPIALKLCEAGSIFKVNDLNCSDFDLRITDVHAKTAGYNKIIWGGK